MTKVFTKRNGARLAAAWLTMQLLTVPGSAAVPVDLPDAGSTLRDSQQTERMIPPQKKPAVEMPEAVRPPVTGPADMKVLVKSFRVTGQTIYPAQQLAGLFTPYTGKELTFEQLQQAAGLVARYFHERGYMVAQAYLPQQEMDGESVEIAVLVGQYGDIILRNKSTVLDNIIRQQVSGLVPGHFVRSGELERAALLAGDISGMDAKVTLAPGKQPGTTDVLVDTVDKPKQWEGSLSQNNWGSRYTGANQTNLNMNWNNLSRIGDGLAATISYAGSGQTTGSAFWRMPVGEGTTLTAGYSTLRYELGADFASLGAYGTAKTSHVDFSYAWKRSRDANLSLKLAYDHKKLEDIMSVPLTTTTRKQSNVVSLGLNGDSVDNFWGGGAISWNITRHRGNLSGTSDTAILPTGVWQKTTFNFYRQQAIASKLNAFIAFSGQFADNNLDSSERFSLGGANAVRAYPSGEGSGDEGLLFTGELRWNVSAPGSKAVSQLIAFYDAGESWIEKHPLIPGHNRRSIAGAGLGINYTRPGDYTLKASYAWKTSAETARSDNDRNGRLWVQAVKLF